MQPTKNVVFDNHNDENKNKVKFLFSTNPQHAYWQKLIFPLLPFHKLGEEKWGCGSGGTENTSTALDVILVSFKAQLKLFLI